MKKPVILLAAIALASCAPPKAIVVEEAPKKPPSAAAPVAPKKPAALADDGLRVGDDWLNLPENNQLRTTAPAKKDGDTTIITSPPTE